MYEKPTNFVLVEDESVNGLLNEVLSGLEGVVALPVASDEKFSLGVHGFNGK
jgi:hypothetical protein